MKKGHSQEKACEETCQTAEEDAGEFHVVIINAPPPRTAAGAGSYSFTATMISEA